MAQPTLYERLGDVYASAAVVNDFVNRIMDNPIRNANPLMDEAHARISKAGFKYPDTFSFYSLGSNSPKLT